MAGGNLAAFAFCHDGAPAGWIMLERGCTRDNSGNDCGARFVRHQDAFTLWCPQDIKHTAGCKTQTLGIAGRSQFTFVYTTKAARPSIHDRRHDS
ncbi:hypothetical protein PF005_g22578 [Phytophthora fragariae]|uniref:Uncharacterized protein n=1 Tax=Phytophthora fragariae TaxID=53985 RepID=A0A6A3QSG1_9STRA|nr:hypothetical protein PF009_g23466 [Phytophthora fragariae]KAE8983438.1 hypothetical protein PF011_g21188 [Phytophthora fragariae]KAE9081627.1 hypothetical protein PF007_g22588 [Phytophthora fragariae]KAE9104984.1 hypothetical protein PF006_g21767 [Phytophthora fragariae]KAE9182235.1 hypothetical protein PF005_g22578 [Phytophthora fragariae]